MRIVKGSDRDLVRRHTRAQGRTRKDSACGFMDCSSSQSPKTNRAPKQSGGGTIRGDDALLFGECGSPPLTRGDAGHTSRIWVSVRSGQDFQSRLPIPQGHPWFVPPMNRLYNLPNLYTPPAGGFQAVSIELLCGCAALAPGSQPARQMQGVTPALRGISLHQG